MLPFEFTEKETSHVNPDSKNFFLLETFDKNNLKRIYGKELLEVFYDWQSFNDFLKNESSKLPQGAGFSGYINYEGDFEFAVFKKIEIENIKYLPPPSSKLPVLLIEEPDPEEYISQILSCKKYIEEGDIYQANLSRKYLIHLKEKFNSKIAFEIYQKLKDSNPNPYQAFMNFKDHLIISFSPESFLKISFDNRTRSYKLYISPIKGTSSKKDFLVNSEKDKAEHIMIVDLERNDLGKISKTGSVKVIEMSKVYEFPNLFHMISTVESELKNDLAFPFLQFEKIFSSCFPCGSITGAPKIRSMEIIKELEGRDRGPFTGSLGYFIFNEGGEFNVLIRSLIYDKRSEEFSLSVGAGITADSDPYLELEETRLKAKKFLDLFFADF